MAIHIVKHSSRQPAFGSKTKEDAIQNCHNISYHLGNSDRTCKIIYTLAFEPNQEQLAVLTYFLIHSL